jgi:hypothetical protein
VRGLYRDILQSCRSGCWAPNCRELRVSERRMARSYGFTYCRRLVSCEPLTYLQIRVSLLVLQGDQYSWCHNCPAVETTYLVGPIRLLLPAYKGLYRAARVAAGKRERLRARPAPRSFLSGMTAQDRCFWVHPARVATRARTICTEVVVICLREEMHLPMGNQVRMIPL